MKSYILFQVLIFSSIGLVFLLRHTLQQRTLPFASRRVNPSLVEEESETPYVATTIARKERPMAIGKDNRKTKFNYAWPLRGVVTFGFGGLHEGIDIDAPQGSPVFAAASGVVIKAGYDEWGLGNKIVIRHDNGSMTVYGHNAKLLVRQGQWVKQGQQIADCGMTGNSNRPHLHFEIRLGAHHPVDPLKLLPALSS